MDYEKLYRDALERAEALYDNESSSADTLIACEAIFPELVVSEDERIRKELLAFLKEELYTGGRAEETWDMKGLERWIAWLEKQGKKTQQTPQWMINFLDENRVKFASSMDDYDEQREAEGKLLAIIDWLENQCKEKPKLNKEDKTIFVYVVTRCEEHSDYVEKVFFDKEKAEVYCKQFNKDEDEYHRDITKVKIN